jgi:hypothetical protein
VVNVFAKQKVFGGDVAHPLARERGHAGRTGAVVAQK